MTLFFFSINISECGSGTCKLSSETLPRFTVSLTKPGTLSISVCVLKSKDYFGFWLDSLRSQPCVFPASALLLRLLLPLPFCFSFYPQENCLSWPESERLRPRQVVIVLNAAVYTMQSSPMAWNCWELIAQIEIVWNDKDRVGLKDVLSRPLWLELNSRHRERRSI